jgi:hypothetical protein
MSVACTIGMAELQHDGQCKNDYKSGAIVFTGGTGSKITWIVRLCHLFIEVK